MPDPHRVAGVDIWSKRWVAVILNGGRFEAVAHDKALKDLVAGLGDVEVIGIDIPIGCPTGKKPRPADLEAKKFIGPKLASAVFLTPTKIVLEQPTRAKAIASRSRCYESEAGSAPSSLCGR